MHLLRHRECLERRCTERGLAAPTVSGRVDELELPPLDRHGRPIVPLPFQAEDDED